MAENDKRPLDLAIPYGRYELLEQIGAGGMAEVFRARLPGVAGFEKQVVIKRLQTQFRDDERFKRMFVEEAKLASQVQHKNVVQVFELGHHEGELYMVLEYVPGTDLKRLLRQAGTKRLSLPTWLSLHIVIEVLEALAFAHDLRDASGQRRNLVHCDVTPENIFLSTGGEVKLGDFGVAHDDTRAEDDFPGEVRGKLAYMAPEQLSGRHVDQRADVFSAAVVLWESLTQRRLFRGPNDDETVSRICHEDRMPPSMYNREVSGALDKAILSALRADRTRRTRTARELQRALLDVQQELNQRVALVDVERALRKILTARPPSKKNDAAILDPSKVPTVESEIPREDSLSVSGSAADPRVDWTTLPPSSDPESQLADPRLRSSTHSRVNANGQTYAPPRRPPRAEPILREEPERPERIASPPSGVMSTITPRPRTPSDLARAEAPTPSSLPAGAEALTPSSFPSVFANRSHATQSAIAQPPPGVAEPKARWRPPSSPARRSAEPAAPPASLAAGWTAALTGAAPPRLPPGHSSFVEPSPLAVAPIRGGTAQVETADILRAPLPRGTPVPERPGSDPVKVVMGSPPPEAPGMWLRRPGSAETGPRPVPDALTVLRRLLLDSPVLDAQVSVDGEQWHEGTLLARLLGEEVVPADGLLPATDDRGTLAGTSLVSIFGRLSRRRQSGRLIVVFDRAGRPDRYELHVHRGRLFHVASSRSLFAAWRTLLCSPEVEQPQLRSWVMQVIELVQPFELVAAASAVEAVRAQQAHFAQDDLQTLFSERDGRYAFAAHPSPPSPNGSGHALLTLLPSLVSRACRTSNLERRLLSRLSTPMERSPDFDAEASQLGLSTRDAEALDRFVDGAPLSRALAEPSSPRMRKLTLVLAYCLSELGLLRPCIAVSP